MEFTTKEDRSIIDSLDSTVGVFFLRSAADVVTLVPSDISVLRDALEDAGLCAERETGTTCCKTLRSQR